jgi:hypothetical protein
MTARHWTPDHRDALLTRVTAITTGTAVVGCVGALGLAVGFATTAHASTPASKAASSTSPSTGVGSGTTTPSGGSGSRTAVDPSQVQVQVLNGVGIAGAARLVADQLRSAGFDVVGIGNAARTVSQSGIIYSPEQAAAFRTLSGATGVTLSSSQGTGAALILVVGQDWQGALPAPQAVPQGRSNGGGNQPQATSGGS